MLWCVISAAILVTWSCGDGACASAVRVCDGAAGCAGGERANTTSECGTMAPEGQALLFGMTVEHARYPWHATIYSKKYSPYMQICGGSLITTSIVLSAAHCFSMSSGLTHPPSDYAVALGKIYRPWNSPRDQNQIKSDVSDIKIPLLYDGGAANFQEDIAVVTLATPVVVTPFIRPVCLDFDYSFYEQQLKAGNTGLVAGFGLTEADQVSPVLQMFRLPFVHMAQCAAGMPATFRHFLTADKFCAGTLNGTGLCRGFGGGGLVFPRDDGVQTRYYLRGIASVVPRSADNICNRDIYTTFTDVFKHQTFIKKYITN